MEFWGLTANGWTALGTMFLAIVTGLLVIVGWYQLRQLREENKRSRTLAVCERYDTDPVLDTCLRNLSRAWDNGEINKEPKKYRIDAATLLNYVVSVFNGVEEEIYDEYLVYSFFRDTADIHATDYLKDRTLLTAMGISADDFETIVKYCQKWEANPPKRRAGICAVLSRGK